MDGDPAGVFCEKDPEDVGVEIRGELRRRQSRKSWSGKGLDIRKEMPGDLVVE